MTADDQSPKYCIECGANLPDQALFCPECGGKIRDTAEGSHDAVEDRHGTVKHDNYNSREIDDDLFRRAEQLAEDAAGSIIPEMLIQTKKPHVVLEEMRSEGRWMLYDHPLISFLDEDEQPHHLLFNDVHGVKILDPDEGAKTPHHGKGRFTFLMPTDKRLLYVAAHDGQDTHRVFDYSTIDRAKWNGSFIKNAKLEFVTTDGCKYKYEHGSISPTNAFSEKAAAHYIDDKAEGDMGIINKFKNEIQAESKDSLL